MQGYDHMYLSVESGIGESTLNFVCGKTGLVCKLPERVLLVVGKCKVCEGGVNDLTVTFPRV